MLVSYRPLARVFNEAGEDAEEASDPSYEKLALWLGGREGMKKKMVVDLAVAFIETFGEWAARERDGQTRGARGARWRG